MTNRQFRDEALALLERYKGVAHRATELAEGNLASWRAEMEAHNATLKELDLAQARIDDLERELRAVEAEGNA